MWIFWLRKNKRVMTPHGAGTVIEFSWFKKNVLVQLDLARGMYFNLFYLKSELKPL